MAYFLFLKSIMFSGAVQTYSKPDSINCFASLLVFETFLRKNSELRLNSDISNQHLNLSDYYKENLYDWYSFSVS